MKPLPKKLLPHTLLSAPPETPATEQKSRREGQLSLIDLLDQIEQRANAATLGPWKAFSDGGTGRNRIGVNGPYGCLCVTGSNSPAADIDATFIAAARSNVPNLIASLRLALPHIPEETQLEIAKLLQVNN